MLIGLRINNAYVFCEEVSLSLKADMRIKKMHSNVHSLGTLNLLKSIAIYGPNNAGKTCVVKTIKDLKNIILNEPAKLQSNMFVDSPIVELGISFLYDSKEFAFDIKYNTTTEEFVFEKLVEKYCDENGKEKTKVNFLRDYDNGLFECEDSGLEKLLSKLSKSSILIHLVDANEFVCLSYAKKALIDYAKKIDIVKLDEIPFTKTINMLKEQVHTKSKIVEFIKNADLYLDDVKYLNDGEFEEFCKSGLDDGFAKSVNKMPPNIIDRLRLASIYKGKAVPSMFFDSDGTKKLLALASYIIDALENGRTLVIDELDNGLHFKLTRAIVLMFNNELNNMGGQLICTVHDITLMDCKNIFRKEQIYFLHKDSECAYLYSLAEFTAESDNIRAETDIVKNYRAGVFGALPDPDMIYTMLDIGGSHEKSVATNKKQ